MSSPVYTSSARKASVDLPMNKRYTPYSPSPLKHRLGIFLRLGVVLAGLIIVLSLGWLLLSGTLQLLFQPEAALPASRPEALVYDPAHLLPAEEKAPMIQQIQSMSLAMQTDWQVVLLPRFEQANMKAVATRLMGTWHLGEANPARQMQTAIAPGRGGLILMAPESHRVVVVLSPALKKVLAPAATDLAAERLELMMAETLRPYLNVKQYTQGVHAAFLQLKNERERVYQIQNNSVNPQPLLSASSPEGGNITGARLVLPPP